ncbi:cupin domain-containing protein [Bradyrhizobium arachidis]
MGDLAVLPPGWIGRWDVTETIRKIYVSQICLRGAFAKEIFR